MINQNNADLPECKTFQMKDFKFEWHHICTGTLWALAHLLWIIFWPIANFGTAFWTRGKYNSEKGEGKIKLHQETEKAARLQMRSHFLEVCIQSSFQVFKILLSIHMII